METNTANEPSEEPSDPPNRILQIHFNDNQEMIHPDNGGVFQWRGNNTITATRLERLKSRSQQVAENARPSRKRHITEMEISQEVENGDQSEIARPRFHQLFDSMENSGPDMSQVIYPMQQ
ncbi:unnamed protein product [Cuscuta epithymum]|uniref:Uncharacterized protein n=1 Tax=Cuscuta epithymum TaxID=186058 RepID=A0AAV0GCT3_9ASTE|nr:unnamed protein product [Cuscuta epithymum]